jgi:hypothetical protein
MRSFLLSLAVKYQVIFIMGITIFLAFLIAMICSVFFDAHQLAANTDLISSVYQVMGTIYAILITFTLWGTWQVYTEASASVQNETFALLDLVHTFEAVSELKNDTIRSAALAYLRLVVEKEWSQLKSITSSAINIQEHSHSASLQVVKAVQNIIPRNEREASIFDHTLTLLSNWLDARRTRLLIAKGNSAKALWPLLFTGALVLFAFHGLFVAGTIGIWAILLFGVSLVIGLTFYLIFTLDCPFSGSPCIDSEPFNLAINILS